MAEPASHPVVLFDGVCLLCAGAVRFIVRHDSAQRFRFAPLQSAAAARLLRSRGATGTLPDSLVLVDEDGVHVRSAAALRIARHLTFPWHLTWALRAVPRPLRDWAYDLVARHRYRWFGRQEACLVPTPELAARFLAD